MRRADAGVLTTLSFAILPIARTATLGDDAWTAVQLDAKGIGCVSSRLARSPIDDRAIFTRSDGRWQLTMFLAGD
jgi:hypothetical protein